MEPDNQTDAIDESALDQELETTLNSIRAENNVPPVETPVEQEAADTEKAKPSEAAAEQTSPAPAQAETPKSDDPQKALEEGFKTPTKGKFESDASYNHRLYLADLVQRRKSAKTEEERQKLSGEIKNVRKDLSTFNSTDKINHQNNGEDTSEKASKEAGEDGSKAAIPATQEDVQALIEQNEFNKAVKSTLDTFVSSHPELADEDVREVFFDFVDSSYNWHGKSGKALETVLELARENMFKPSETIQERVLKSADVAEKVNAMTFPGGTIVTPAFTPDQNKSIDEMVATGMSREKAIELISE